MWELGLILASFSIAAHAKDDAGCPKRYEEVLQKLRTGTAHLVSNGEGPLPSQIALLKLNLRRPSHADFKAAREGRDVRYIIDQNDQVWILPEGSSLSLQSINFVHNSAHPGAEPFLVKGSGSLVRDPKTNGFSLKAQNGLALTDEEASRVLDSVRKTNPGIQLSRDGIPQAKVLSCLDIHKDHVSGTHFVRDQLFAGNLVTGTVILYEESKGAGRLESSQGFRVIMADIIGNNVGSLAYGVLAQKLHVHGVGNSLNTAARLALGTGLTVAQNGLYRSILNEEKPEERANKIMGYDLGFLAARTPIALATDQIMLNRLPDLYYNACLRDSSAKLIVSPTVIRIAERAAWTWIYYRGRELAVQE